ncbi:hypothetical protein CWB99_06785 [Pseudoalteromonas rubra]|uniref:Uncharacterized protein n=1 Tax=Pseudoalteromonas rubra TaxID=43658 RepID=A0A5S3WNT6_9GAMM|nr:hypothetical protein [Pseudoalteromonas rubra]TMP30038.1 hypothetical protein CWB99_06785 [Pseudoalteromonas rubra]TMP35693.1 hypothetical protein CWC00_04085 [Pseudoalteromonas rubra]
MKLALPNALQPALSPLIKIQKRWLVFWHALNVAQRCYFSATTLCLIAIFNELPEDNSLYMAASILALIAMTKEFWPRFIHLWESLPGKAVILLFYAFIANYALAQAAGMVNDITGVNADHLPYSHNFSMLLSVPTWFVTTSILLLILLQLIQPIYLFVLMLLRPFGLHKWWHSPDYQYPVTTGLVRFFFGLFLLYQMAVFISSTGMSRGVNSFLRHIVEGFTGQSIQVNIAMQEGSENGAERTTIDAVAGSAVDDVAQAELAEKQAELQELQIQLSAFEKNADKYERHLQNVLTYFIYEYESDSRSRCEITPGTRIIELNDYELLEITKIEGEPTRYEFVVKPCISAAIGHQFRATPDSR